MLPKSIFECPRSLAVNQAYAPKVGNDGLVEVFINCLPSLVSKHTAQIDFVSKIAIDLCVKIGGVLFLLAANELRLFFNELQIGKLGSCFENTRLNQNRTALIGCFKKYSLFIDVDDIDLVAAFEITRKNVFLALCYFPSLLSAAFAFSCP